MAVLRLEGAGIAYREIVHPPGTRDALSFAEQLGLPYERVFKTLVVAGGPGLIALCCIPVLTRLDERAVATTLGWRKAALATLPAIRERLGTEPGAISPLLLPELPLLADDSVEDAERMWIGAGAGRDVELASEDFVAVCEPRLAAIRR